MKQAHIIYSGRVQGVGFRFTVEDIANQLGVCGWVKNLGDGRVEILAQAKEEILKEFLDKIGKYFSGYINDVEVKWEEASDKLKDFRVTF